MNRNEALWLLVFLAVLVSLSSRESLEPAAVFVILILLPVLLLLEVLERLRHWLYKWFLRVGRFVIRYDLVFGQLLTDPDEEISAAKIGIFIGLWCFVSVCAATMLRTCISRAW